MILKFDNNLIFFFIDEKKLTQQAIKSLTRIFKLWDNDGLLNDVELNEFQLKCFGVGLVDIAAGGESIAGQWPRWLFEWQWNHSQRIYSFACVVHSQGKTGNHLDGAEKVWLRQKSLT